MEQHAVLPMKQRANRWRRAAFVGSGLGLVAANAFYGLSSYIIWRAMHPPKIALKKHPAHFGIQTEEVHFKSSDGLSLRGWWMPVENSSKAVVFSHAYGLNRYNMPFPIFDLVKVFQSQGYSVLMYDFRNAGESDGNETTIALKEQLDLNGAIEFVKHEKSMDHIILIGWSMGASTSLLAGCRHDDVKGIIADSPFASLDSYVLDSFEYWTKLPRFIGRVSSYVTKLNFLGFKPHLVKPIEVVKKAEGKKIMIVHAKNDPAISCTESERMKRMNSDIDLWQPEMGGHIEAYRLNKQEYEDRVVAFLKEL
ncbi:alpha/beta fold hydrolase [Bacillus sp. FJAT-42376]|uniref:alpha/beta hydrolase n=1 Tax=Bacillus sp. FJAT-42376 TaxID=2014076 RepID=UPI000F4D8A18|nr:alpha/beta fold hydrolase [Bacillus sp. FJAT-42376]AZB44501.1 alpha/beta fold hydrolase [Bacillus sp. FJAT-42376]